MVISRRLARVCAAWTLLSVAACMSGKPSDYEIDLAQIHVDIAALNERPSTPAVDVETTMRQVLLLHRRASLTGSFADFKDAEAAIDGAVLRIGPSQELYLLKARLDFAFHRLANARDGLRLASAPAAGPRVRELRADLDLQEGRYQDAQREYENVIEKNRSWDNLARLAYLKSITGDGAGAAMLYVEAESEITAKEMRSYAWVKVQRGLLEFRRGRHEEALKHYLLAEKAYSGYWFVEEHIAELLGAQRRFEEAVSLYEKVIRRAPKPELYQALGDLYAFMGQPDRAKPWHEKALGAYLESARRGEVHYFHHLAGFYADVREDGAEAVKWARKDLDLRGGSAAHDALAWALYRDGRYAEAQEEMNQALAPGVQEAHTYFHAAMINVAAGQTAEGQRFLRQAVKANPRFYAFHAHR